ncbi:MAG: hypothetical protein IT173_12210 [Acidobacteria bacterium]|nr:hypothetical protein [Acidobacteriota bacterium]
MSHGLKGKVKEIVVGMNAVRENKDGGRDIGLRQFMAENYTDSSQQPLAPEHLYAELGIDPQRTLVKDLMANEDNAYLMSEVVRDGVRRGLGIAQREMRERAHEAYVSQGPVTADGGAQRFMSPDVFLAPLNLGIVQGSFYQDLIVREEIIPQPTATIPKIDLSKATLVDSAEAATIEEGSVSYGSKQVTVKKKARGIKITYEAIKFNTLSLVQIFFEDAGRILGHTLNAMAVDTIVNGEQAGGAEAAAVVGVESTTNKITWFDLTRLAIQGALIGRTFNQAIGNATTALSYLNLPEVKDKQFPGAPLLATRLRTPLTMPEELFVSASTPANQMIFQDDSLSLIQLTAMPLMVETEKIISKQIEQSFASIMTGFAKLHRTASVILDGSVAFSGAGFPAWMQPFATE